MRVELKQVAEQVERVVRSRGEHVTQTSGLGGRQRLEHGGGEGAINRLDVLLRWPARYLHDAVELVQGGGAREDGFTEQELRQDAAQTPHVHALGVVVRAEQNLRRSVPPRCDVVSQERLLVRPSVKRASQAEIGHLDMALGVEEQVTRLEIPVQQIRRVHILETL